MLSDDTEQSINQLMTNVPHHIETNQLIYSANQLTGFYIMGDTVVNELNNSGLAFAIYF